MLLDTFAAKQGLALSTMAIELGVCPSYLSMVAKGERRPSALLCCKIEIYTNGLVTRDELIRACPPRNCPCCGKRIGDKTRKKVNSAALYA